MPIYKMYIVYYTNFSYPHNYKLALGQIQNYINTVFTSNVLSIDIN